jgi:hypothetical protein
MNPAPRQPASAAHKRGTLPLAVLVTAALALLGCITSRCEATAANERASALRAHVFAPDSFWYRPIPKDAPLHPNSENFVREFLHQIKSYYGNVTINTARYSAPIYVVGHDVQARVVTPWDCQKRGHIDGRLKEQWQAVPIPN